MQFLQEYRKNSARLKNATSAAGDLDTSGRSSSDDHYRGLVLDPNSGPAIIKLPKLEILPDAFSFVIQEESNSSKLTAAGAESPSEVTSSPKRQRPSF